MRPGIRQKLQQSFSVLALAFVFVAFQNFSGCMDGKLDFASNSKQPPSTANQGGGGGDGYPTEGKPSIGTYIRNIPGYTCGGIRRIYSIIEVGAESAVARTIDPSDCSEKSRTVALSELSVSGINRDLVGASDGGLYEKVESLPEPAKATNPVVALCQVRGRDDVAFDVKVNYDEGELRSVATLAGTRSVGGIWSAVPTVIQQVSQTLAASRVNFSGSTPHFSLEVLLDVAANMKDGLLKTTFDGVAIDQSVKCYSAGQFDPQPKPRTTIHLATPSSVSVPIGTTSFALDLNLDFVQMDSPFYTVCVAMFDAGDTRLVVHNCFDPSPQSDLMFGPSTLAAQVQLPAGAPAGNYRITASYQRWVAAGPTGWIYAPVNLGPGTSAFPSPDPLVVVGTLQIGP